MPNAFELAAASLHADANLSVAASYTPTFGPAPIAIRVIRWATQREAELGGGFVQGTGNTFEVLMTALARQPQVGDVLTIGLESWKIFDVSILVRRSAWLLGGEARQ